MRTHWGSKDFQVPVPEAGFGQRSAGHDQSVEGTFRSCCKFGVADYKDSVAEEVYTSTKRLPLGVGYNRGHALPQVTLRPEYRFGKATVLDRPAKELVNPHPAKLDTEEASELPRKSPRDYDWPSSVEDAANFSFGHVPAKDSSNQGSGVKAVLAEEGCAKAGFAVPGTVILPGASVHHRQVVGYKLGKPRNLNQCAERALPPSHTFGAASNKEPFDVSELVHRSYPAAEQMPDGNLGRCVKQGRRNFVTREPLGVPSVRVDRAAPPREKRSVASHTNFGDDSNAVNLLSPGRFNNMGIDDVDFRRLRPEPELRSIFEGAGLGDGLSPEALEAAARSCGSSAAGVPAGSPVASVQALMHVCADWSAARSAAPALPLGG